MRSLMKSLTISLFAVGLFSSQSVLAKVVAFECVSETVFVASDDYKPSEMLMESLQKLIKDTGKQTNYHLVDLNERVWETRGRVLTNVVVSPSQISVLDSKGYGITSGSSGEYLMINRTDLKFATKGLERWGNLEQRGTCEIEEQKESLRAF